ncbi:TetR/AcrR family transcriptional regulator [Burkholderia cenocepacia]|uniref:TetR/AcrR family transcriptional regulator n=1 Tax=Burkholderia cenocepacia TaxID=95486 RepID=UPI0009B5207B|nr:TetR/AcrR family transcriptional regulator [Burkholderia cenocepacia]
MRADAQRNYDRLLEVAREVVAEHGADASLRDVARRAGVGLGTLYRHFPTRDALLEALLRASFDKLTTKAHTLEASSKSDEALVTWMREAIAVAHNLRGAVASMMAAIEDQNSALHASTVRMRTACSQLLVRAQAEGKARTDVNGADLFSLISALAWLNDQPSCAPRAGHLFEVIASSILPCRGKPPSQRVKV